MRKIISILLVTLFVSVSVHAAENTNEIDLLTPILGEETNSKVTNSDWDTQDKLLLGTYNLLYLIDWGQTRYISDRANKKKEYNPFLGEHPSIEAVNLYFIQLILLQNAVIYILPEKYRKYYMIFFIGYETGLTTNNYNAGINIQF